MQSSIPQATVLVQPAYLGSPEQALGAIDSGPSPSLRSRAPHRPPLIRDVVDAALHYGVSSPRLPRGILLRGPRPL